MSLTTIELNGVEYHAQYTAWDEAAEDWDLSSAQLILDENANPIPATVCLCSAYEPSECVCGAWDDVKDWEDSRW